MRKKLIIIYLTSSLIVERLDRAFKKNEYEQESKTIMAEIRRKLYQKPHLSDSEES